MRDRILIIEQNPQTSRDMSAYFERQHCNVQVAPTLEDARQLVRESAFDPHVAIAECPPDCDIAAGIEEMNAGVEHCEWILALDKPSASQQQALADVAFATLPLPLDTTQLRAIVSRALRSARTTRRLRLYARQREGDYEIGALVGNSPAIVDLKKLLKRLSDVPVSNLIICGETGTGKGLVARILHNTGLRREGPMVELNCAALPRDLLESELFGHESGAFTGARGRHRGLLEQAHGGTLFLDELCDMDIDLQAKLLKAIEDRKVRRVGGEQEVESDIQLIAATSANLEDSIREQRLRADLYHRLSVFRLEIPPLRARKSDLAELVPRIIAELNEKSARQVDIVPDEVWHALMDHDWPGNIRELRNVIERCVLLSTDDVFPAEWLQLGDTPPPASAVDIEDSLSVPLDGSMSLSDMDRFIIRTALERNNHNITETARVLRTTRETLRYRIQKYHLDKAS